MLYFYSFIFSIQGKSDLNTILVVSLLPSSLLSFYHSVGREDLLVSAGKENFFFCCTELGSDIDVAFFLTKILMRSSLSGGIALFSTFTGTICHFEHTLQICHLAVKKENISAHLVINMNRKLALSQLKTRFDVQTWHNLCSFPQQCSLTVPL